MGSKKRTILLVEDETLIALGEALFLEREGYDVIRVMDGETAVETALHGRVRINLILMDINLGRGMDGTEAARLILAERDIPLIFLSSHAEPEVVRSTEEISSYGYVLKNSGPTVLSVAVGMAFRLYTVRRELQEKGEELATAHEELQAAYEELQAANEEYQTTNQELLRSQAELLASREELLKQKELLSLTGSMAKVGGWEFDAQTREGSWTDEVARIHGLDPAEPTRVALGVSFYAGESKTKIEEAIREAVERGRPYDLELELVDARGVRKWVHTIGHPLIDSQGRVTKIHGTFQEISELKRVEAELRTSLAEKEVLFREIRHRMKNYLEMASSMIGLQLSCGSGAIPTVLENTQLRLRAMAQAYDHLGDTGPVGSISLESYLQEVLNALTEVFSETGLHLRLDAKVEGFATKIEQALPLGLIVNELVTNAYKYAYPDKRGGDILISLRNEDENLELTVADRGRGFPEHFTIESAEGTGFLIIRALAEQLGARLSIANAKEGGAVVALNLGR